MAFPTSASITPCLTKRFSPETREGLKNNYRIIKKYGIRGVFGLVTGTGFYTLAKEMAKDGIVRHGKRYLGCIIMNTGLSCVSFSIPLLTNATKVVQYAKAAHSACGGAWRAAHNVAELPLLVCDFIIFGEAVPSCGPNDYDFLSNNASDFINELTK